MESSAAPQKHLKTRTISFIGIDGSGKTTQANYLIKTLHMQGNSIKYIHFFSSGRIVTGEPQPGSLISTFLQNLDKPTDNRLEEFIRLLTKLMGILLDSWLTHFHNARKYADKIVIYDRYYYDSLVVLAFRTKTLKNIILILSKLIPKPNIIVLFKVTPSTSVIRKAEQTIEDAEKICNLYLRLTSILPIYSLNAELSIKQLRLRIAGICEGV